MKLEEIYSEWEKDGAVDVSNITNESSNIPKLHNKYYKIYLEDAILLKNLRAKLSKLKKLKAMYYRDELDPEELKELEWKPLQSTILKKDVAQYVESDDDIVKLTLKIGIQEEKVQYLESILRMISNRGYQIKNIIDWERFTVGAL